MMSMKKKWLKPTAILTLGCFLMNVFYPTTAYALTGGPSHPEIESFEPAGTTEMVDPFTGDFNYNLPLLTIPGPNGGYPINLSYHAGIGMEQEASWVGLGWNLNPGSINRQMRGIPDDFNGDKIKQQMSFEPSTTVSIGVSTGTPWPEDWGANLEKTIPSHNASIYYNNYKGMGVKYAVGLSFNSYSAQGSDGTSGSVGIASFDSNDGLSLTPSLSFSHYTKEYAVGGNIGFGYSAREGFNSFNIGVHGTSRWNQKNKKGNYYNQSAGGGIGISTNFSGYIPSISYNTQSYSLGLSFGFQAGAGPGGVEFKVPINIFGNFSRDYLSEDFKTQNVPAYGYNHTGDRIANGEKRALMDYNREKDYPIHVRVPFMPVPIFTNDNYSITGHGIGGSFRPFRSDFGLLYEPMSEKQSGSGSLGFELGLESQGVKVGINPYASYSYSYKGKWTNGLENIGQLNFKRDADFLDASNPSLTLNRQFYYKSMGELTSLSTQSMDEVGGENAVKLIQIPLQTDNTDAIGNMSPDVGEPPLGGTTSFVSQIEPSFSGLNNTKRSIRTEKEKNVQDIQYLTRDEKTGFINYSSRAKMIYDENQFPVLTSGTGSQFDYSTSHLHSDPTASLGIGHHIAEYSVVNPDGNRYNYGLPVYNTKDANVSFSVAGTNGKNYPRLQSYDVSVDPGFTNDKGLDRFFSSTEVPHYAYSYLLTEITSPDYVDITGNGCSEDDYGYYTKFNYSSITQTGTYYKWRYPYSHEKGSYVPGYMSNDKDNKVTYNYGEKEIWYVNSIETKTHIAVFRTSDRFDGVGADQHGNPQTNVSMKKLDRIDLYSKEEVKKALAAGGTPTPIKSVHFAYSYDLCGNVSNNRKTLGLTYMSLNNHPHPLMSGQDENINGGKLTLKKVWFTYRNNDKGSLSPYYFDYEERDPGLGGAIDGINNPNYQHGQVDRWGNFRPDGDYNNSLNTGRLKNSENPYVKQDVENKVNNLDKEVSVWNLKQIQLPSGGKIDINYESDDYSHVQDKVAHQMCDIVGTGDGGTGTTYDVNHDDFFQLPGSDYSDQPNSINLLNTTTRLYFKPDYPLHSNGTIANQQVQSYITGLLDNFLYFKTYQRLKVPKSALSGFVYDYVEGYCKVTGAGYINTSTSNGPAIMGFNTSDPLYATDPNIDWSKVPYVEIEKVHVGSNDWNPLRFAGWQYLRYSRQDLSNDMNGMGILTIIYQIIMSVFELFIGYNGLQDLKAHCKFIQNDRPSYIRLSSPDKIKYGGGYRVQSISVNDNWDAYAGAGKESIYGNKYFYRMEDGTSSGVASYEPMMGADEIALRKPHYYSSADNLLYHNPDFYLEEPFCESYYPSPTVGYRRVLIENIHHGLVYNPGEDDEDKVMKTMEGITEYLFYTSKEFPIVAEHSNDPRDMYIDVPITIPLIGSINIRSAAYSQAYKVETNDMHGKLRALNIYDADEDKNGDGIFENTNPQPTKSSEYIYQTMDAFDDNKVNRLDNHATVLLKDGITDNAILGQNFEFFGDMQQDDAFSFGAGLDVNVTVEAPFIVVPFLIPSIDVSMMRSRSVTTNKIIYKNAILKEVIENFEGNSTHIVNELWDAETGQVLLNRITTDYNNDPNSASNDFVYNYHTPAHWYYPAMGGAYKNYRALVKFENATTPGYYKISNITDFNDVLQEGDIIMRYSLSGGNLSPVAGEIYWINDPGFSTSNSEFIFKLMKEDGSNTTGLSGYFQVVKPIRANLQTEIAGTIQTLKSPLTSTSNDLITQYNTASNKAAFTSIDCGSDARQDCSASLSTSGTNNYFTLSSRPAGSPDAPCFSITAQIPDGISAGFYKIISMNSSYIEFEISPGNNFLAPVTAFKNDCNSTCLDGVLNAGAAEFVNFYTYNYNNFNGNPFISTNPYRTGVKGIWRTRKALVYNIKRKQTDITSVSTSKYNSYTGKDGTFERFNMHNWKMPQDLAVDQSQPQWLWTSIVSKYSPLGWAYESLDPLGNYSTELYARDYSLVLATATNASSLEIAYEGFETYITGYPASFGTSAYCGHIPFPGIASPSGVFSGTGHTGDYALRLGAGTIPICTTSVFNSISNSVPSTGNTFSPITNKTYLVSAWIRKDGVDFNDASTIPGIDVIYTAGTTQTLSLRIKYGTSIEQWYKVEGTFKNTSTTGSVYIKLIAAASGGTCYFDDIRIQPVNSGMKTYVYDWYSFNLVAELDNNNYATFYNYNNEGKLVQVKQETEKGIISISASSSNVKR
jgi:hypothetical protein